MGRALCEAFPYCREQFAEADAALGFSLSTLCFDGPEAELVRTQYTQPALLVCSLSACEVLKRERCDEYIGTLVNAYLAAGGQAVGIRAGASYFDVGTLDGYRAAMQQLSQVRRTPHPAVAVAPSRRDRNPNGSARGA